MKKHLSGRNRLLRPWILATVILCFLWFGSGMAFAEGEEETAPEEPKSQAVIVHQPLHYTYDYNKALGERISLEGSEETYGNWNNLPILFPGDKVTIIPKLPSASQATRNGDTISGTAGVVFINPYSAESRDPVQVTKVEHYGKTPETADYDNSFIQEFEITGTEPVMVFSNGGGGYTSEPVEHPEYANITLAYGINNLEFKYFPGYCTLAYQYADIDTGAGAGLGIFEDDFLATELHYYSDEQDMDAIWATDAVNNAVLKYVGEDVVTYTVRHPYIEGYYVYKIITGNTTSHAYRIQSNSSFDSVTDTLTITPGWSDNSRTGGDYTRKGDYAEDWTQVRFEFLACRTLTLEACGGTIQGYPSRIYKAAGNTDLDALEDLWEKEGMVPERKGYLFQGWYEDASYETPVTNLRDTLAGYSNYNGSPREERVCRIYAKWQQLGWVQDGSKWYYYDKTDGSMKTGWTKIGKKWYFFDKNDGSMQTGWLQSGKKWYYFDPKDGSMKTGWVKSGKNWYYMDKKDGFMKTNAWVQDGKWYYFKSDGTMAKSEWCKGYWLNKDGTCTYNGKASWKKNKNGWYYSDNLGWYAKNETLTIDGKKYTFDAEGYLKD